MDPDVATMGKLAPVDRPKAVGERAFRRRAPAGGGAYLNGDAAAPGGR